MTAMLTWKLTSRLTSRSLVGLGVGLTAGVLLAGVVAPVATASPADPGLRTKINKVMADPRVQDARSGAIVQDGRDGRRLYSRNPDRTSIPASNAKIATAVTAMHVLGPDYRFKTEVIRRNRVTGGTLHGDLYLKGYGDPTLHQSDLRVLAEKVRAAGIRTVTGDVVVDSSFFDNNHYNPGWSKSYADAYYAAPVYGLTLAPDADDNAGTVQLNYEFGSARGKRAKISFTPAGVTSYLKVSNEATTVRRGAATTLSVSRAYGSSTIKLRGTIARGTRGHILITVARPDLMAGTDFRHELRLAGVKVKGHLKAETIPAHHHTVVARDTSITLSKLLVPFLKLSNNSHAEAITKAMGALNGHPGSWSGGLQYTKDYLRRLGVPSNQFRLQDGSGLNRSDRLTPRAVSRVLFRVQHTPWFTAFHAALPVAGNPERLIGGSLADRMRGTRAANNARAKTGSLTGVSALSGYVRGRNGRLYVFSMMTEYSGASPEPVEDEFVETLANRG